MRHAFAGMGLLLVLGSVSLAGKPGLARGWLGADAVAIIENAEKIETFRIEEDFGRKEESENDERVAGRLLLARGKDFSEKQSATLKKLVLADTSYDWRPGAKGCKPTPGVIFRFVHEGRYVDVILCFECRQWAMPVSDGKQKEKEKNKEKWEDFDPVYRQLAKLAKQAFPDDAVIRKL